MKVCVLSACIGGNKKNHVVKQEGFEVDFFFYNNGNLPTRQSSFTPRMNAKIPKMLGWMLNPGYDYYIWMDDRFGMSRPDAVAWFIQNIKGHDALFFKHPFRNTIKQECDYMLRLLNNKSRIFEERLNGEDIEKQINIYLSDHRYADNKLFCGGSFCYSSELVKNTDYNFMKEWFFHTCYYSIRDQLSLPYLIYQFNINYKIIKDNVFNLEYLK